MITLNSERGFEKVDTWEEIVSLPGFTDNLDPKKFQLKEIIGRYIFKEKIPCGLTSCKQPHGKGYIVTTKTGEVANIGNVCGKTHFGVEFNELSKIFNRAITEHNNREIVGSFIFQLEANIERVENIRSGNSGADWVYKTSRGLIQKGRGCPESVTSYVSKLVRSRNGAILIPRIATENEVKDMEVIQKRTLERPQYIEESRGNLRGLDALFPENDLRELLIIDMEANLKSLADLDIDNATFKDIQYWSKWCSEFDAKLEKAERILSSGQQMLSKDNLSQLLSVIDDQHESSEFRKWLAATLNTMRS